MNPGATTRPAASMVRVAAAPAYLPTPTIVPSCTATSARNPSSPVPSPTRPFVIKRSYAMLLSPHCPAPDEPGALAAGPRPPGALGLAFSAFVSYKTDVTPDLPVPLHFLLESRWEHEVIRTHRLSGVD